MITHFAGIQNEQIFHIAQPKQICIYYFTFAHIGTGLLCFPQDAAPRLFLYHSWRWWPGSRTLHASVYVCFLSSVSDTWMRGLGHTPLDFFHCCHAVFPIGGYDLVGHLVSVSYFVFFFNGKGRSV